MTTAAIKYREYECIGKWSERERVSNLAAAMSRIAASEGSRMVAFEVAAASLGLPIKTVQRKFYTWQKHGDMALADGRKMTRGVAESVYYADFKTYAEDDKNTSRGGYDTMMRDFRAGKSFSFGTWRDVWQKDFPFEPVPALCPRNWTPRGLTYANMMRLQAADATSTMSLAWNRRGQYHALSTTLPVVRSRVGLPVGAVYQADDVWHNIDVFAPGIKGVFNPLEFAIYDVASAFKAVSVMKPRQITIDPKTGKEVRNNLKEQQFRFAISYLVCEVGFHKDGVTFILERGTTAVRENVQRRVADIPGYGRLFKFQVSGIKDMPAHKGMFIGNCGGNPRMKSLCECAHNIMHNATASFIGNHGRDNHHTVESAKAVVKYSSDIIAQAERLDPMLVTYLQLPILDWKHYCQFYSIIENEVMDRHDHRLEGWAAREVMEYRLSDTSDVWLPTSGMCDMSPEQAVAIRTVIATNPEALMRKRRMSRREAWKAGQKDMITLPMFEMPAFLDPRDVGEATVRRDGTIRFTDAFYYPGEEKIYIAEMVDRNGMRKRLAPGDKVKFFWNPIGKLSQHIWISDKDGGVVGMCQVLKSAAWVDPESVKVAMGQQAHYTAEIMADTRSRHASATVARLAAEKVNSALIATAKETPKIERMGGAAVGFERLAGEVAVSQPVECEETEGNIQTDVGFLERMNGI